MVHHCPRCELRFGTEAELAEHMVVDHHQSRERWEHYRYPSSGRQQPLYATSTDSQRRGPAPRRFLVVANQSLGTEQLTAHLRGRMAEGPCRFFVLVPATHPADYPVGTLTYAGTVAGGPSAREATTEEGAAQARWRLRQAIEALRSLGADARGEVGDPDPLAAVRQLLGREAFDEIIVSTLPAGLSRWLGMDVPGRLRRHVNLPVTAVTPESV